MSYSRELFTKLYQRIQQEVEDQLARFRPKAFMIDGVLKVSQGGTGNGSGSTTPKGPAGGDLSGTYPNPTVSGIQAVSVDATAPVDTQVLAYHANVDKYVPTDPDSGPTGPPGPPGADGTGFTLPSPGGGAVLVSLVPDAYVWAYPLFSDGAWLTGDDGEPLYVEA